MTASRTPNSRWPATSSTGSTCVATSASSTRAAVTGRVTEVLLARVPNGAVAAVDGSAAMVEETRKRLGDRVEAYVSDLVELELTQPVDAILSTATFHWIADHERFSPACTRR